MFFKRQYDYKIIDKNVTEEEIKEVLKENNIHLSIEDPSGKWAGFSNYYALKNGFNNMKSGSFAYMTSLFLSGLGASCGTEMYYKEEEIEYTLYQAVQNITHLQDLTEQEKAKMVFDFIFNFYKLDADNYERVYTTFTMKLTYSEYEKFINVEGETKADKFRTLLANYE